MLSFLSILLLFPLVALAILMWKHDLAQHSRYMKELELKAAQWEWEKMKFQLEQDNQKRLEAKQDAKAKRVASPPPINLLSLALRESEGWAREQAVQQMYELYQQHGDWLTVEKILVSGLN